MSKTNSTDSDRYEDVDGIYIDEDGNPRPEVETLSKGGEPEDAA